MRALRNPHRGTGLDLGVAPPSVDAEGPLALLARCPVHAPTPMAEAPGTARALGIASLRVKDERGRMGMGSFKALGAAYVIARHAAAGEAEGRTYVTASAGNHGLSVAAGARVFGARARIYLAETVPDGFADRPRAERAEVRVEGADYEASMAAAARDAEAEGLFLLSDSSWEGYDASPRMLMEGYLAMAAEMAEAEAPDVLLLQAGVGGMAGAVAAYLRGRWPDALICTVEPTAAPAILASIEAGGPARGEGPESTMGRLDCKEPSLIGLAGLSRDADWCLSVTDAAAEDAAARLGAEGLATTPSGAAGVAGLIAHAEALGLGPDARAMAIVTEAP